MEFTRSEIARLIADVTGRRLEPVLSTLRNAAVDSMLIPVRGAERNKTARYPLREAVRAYILTEIHSFGLIFADLARLNERLNKPVIADDFTNSPGTALDEIIHAAQIGREFSIYVRMGMEDGEYRARFSFAARNARVDATLDLLNDTKDAVTLRVPAATLAGEILAEVLAEVAAER